MKSLFSLQVAYFNSFLTLLCVQHHGYRGHSPNKTDLYSTSDTGNILLLIFLVYYKAFHVSDTGYCVFLYCRNLHNNIQNNPRFFFTCPFP